MGKAGNENTAKLKSIFAEMLVYKRAQRNKFFSALGIPSYLRDLAGDALCRRGRKN
ncbi:MAG: hypothetical protein AB1523_01240 [Bacillota bacterium]